MVDTSFTFKGKTLFFDEWIKSGILYVKDIFKENSKLKSTRDILDILDRLNIKRNYYAFDILNQFTLKVNVICNIYNIESCRMLTRDKRNIKTRKIYKHKNITLHISKQCIGVLPDVAFEQFEHSG